MSEQLSANQIETPTLLHSEETMEQSHVDRINSILRRELEAALQLINLDVDEQTGMELDLGIVDAEQDSPSSWDLTVQGKAYNQMMVHSHFRVEHREEERYSPLFLFQHQLSLGEGVVPVFETRMEISAKELAKNIAIYTHRSQIAGVLMHD